MKNLLLALSLLVAACGGQSPAAPSPLQTPEQILGSMAVHFLHNFGDSTVPVDVVMQDFYPPCVGTEDERQDTIRNRERIRGLSTLVSEPRVAIFEQRQGCDLSNAKGRACIYVDVEWRSLIIAPADDPHLGQVLHSTGTDQLTGEYYDGRWWLCSSSWFSRSAEYLPQ